MRLAVLNVNQSAAIKLGLDLTDIALIDWMISFSSSGRMEHRTQDGALYFWVSFKKLCDDLPVLGIGERQAARRFNSLVDKGIFSSIRVATRTGLKVFIRVIPEAYESLYMQSEAMSPTGYMQEPACHPQDTCACHPQDTCSYTSPIGEDITDNTLSDNLCGEAENFATDSRDDDPTFIILPCRRGAKNKKTEYVVKESEIKSMEEAFPAVDVRYHYRRMEKWIEAKPERKKTYDGMKTFIYNWLANEQDKGWRSAKAQSSAKTANAAFDGMAVGGEVSL